MSRYDWDAIRRFYDAGHSLRETRTRFGFSNGAWAAAVARGDVSPRSGRPRGRNGETRARVAQLLASGMSKAAVARELGIARSSVSRHAARSGYFVDERCATRYDWAAVQLFYDAGNSISDCQAQFGMARKTIYDAVRRGDFRTRSPGAALEDICIAGVPRQRGHIKSRLLRAGVKQSRCEECGLEEWRGRPLVMQLHHVNGISHDNRVENLQLLCPNCHSQTDNWGGRNAQRRAA